MIAHAGLFDLENLKMHGTSGDAWWLVSRHLGRRPPCLSPSKCGEDIYSLRWNRPWLGRGVGEEGEGEREEREGGRQEGRENHSSRQRKLPSETK